MNSAIKKARDLLDRQFVKNPLSDAHGVEIGVRMKDGVRLWDEPPVVVVKVPRKKPLSALSQRAIPSSVKIYNPQSQGGYTEVPVDVQEVPIAEALGNPAAHRACQSPVCRGGCEIQPQGQGWVGTAGGLVISENSKGEQKIVCLTNAHVTGLNARVGTPIIQPGSGRSPFAKVYFVNPITNGDNYLDAALLDVESGGFHMMIPEQTTLGRLGKSFSEASVGGRVVKDGRTTGQTSGRCSGIGATRLVNYGSDGTKRFVNQITYVGDSGDLSAGGDSGSFILEAGTNNPQGLLFAGGGGETIANPFVPYLRDNFRLKLL